MGENYFELLGQRATSQAIIPSKITDAGFTNQPLFGSLEEMSVTSVWSALNTSGDAIKTTPPLTTTDGMSMPVQWFPTPGAKFFSYTLDYSESKLEQNVLNPANLQAKLELGATRKVT